jgi:hypothetical protein
MTSKMVDVSTEENGLLSGWQPTTLATMKDYAESARVSRKIRAGMSQCWFNARKAVMKLEDYANASYIEGWAVFHLAVEHGWIVHNGKIIDPTLPDREGVYFPGLEFRGRQGIETFLATKEGKKCKRSPFFYAFGWGGMESPSFRQCYEDAQACFTARCS